MISGVVQGSAQAVRMKTLQADYLVVGAGAMGMAFTDVLMTETEASVVMVDRRHQPGGHWNDAYPFVRLHQPSSFYGVNSRPLGSGAIDTHGWNKGLYELATNSEVCAYFGQVMQRQFLPSGRVRYFPLCEYQGNGRFTSLVSDEAHEVQAGKIVDATYMDVAVPSVSPPPFAIDEGANWAPLNELPKLGGQFERYVIVGAGKTGMDACLFLLAHGMDPDNISWVMPRDSWMLDRANIQPGRRFADAINRGFAAQTRAIVEGTGYRDVFERIHAAGQLLRLDDDVWPTMYRCATVTVAELAQLRRIKNVVRLGHVQRIEPDAIILDQGTAPTSPATLHVHCATDGLARRPVAPVFDGKAITLQSLRTCQQVFSGAFTAHVEAAYADDDEVKNRLCVPVPHPASDVDFLRTTLANLMNQLEWAQDEALLDWLRRSRLDGFTPPESDAEGPLPTTDPGPVMEAIPILQRMLAETEESQRLAAS